MATITNGEDGASVRAKLNVVLSRELGSMTWAELQSAYPDGGAALLALPAGSNVYITDRGARYERSKNGTMWLRLAGADGWFGGYLAPASNAVCVDSWAGADTNAGTEVAPVRTLTKARTLMSNGSTVALARGSMWRETLDVSTLTGTLTTSYGDTSLPMPLICCDDAVQATQWSKTGGRTNVYQVSWTHTITNGYLQVWEDGVQLTPVADQATCDSTPASFVKPGLLSSAGTITVYIHATSSGNPASNGKVYEIQRREWAYYGGSGGQTNHVRGLWVRRPGISDGAIRADLITECLSTEGSKHNIWVNAGGTATRCAAYRSTSPDIGYTSATQFITYTAGASATTTTHEDCYSYIDGAAATSGMVSGFASHTSGGGAKITGMTYNGVYGYRISALVQNADTTLSTITDAWAERSTSFGSGETLAWDNVTWMPYSIDGAFATGTPVFTNSVVGGTVSNLKAYIEGNMFNAVFRAGASTPRLTQSTIVSAGTGYVTLARSFSNGDGAQIDRCLTYQVNRLTEFDNATSDLAVGSDYNCFYKPTGSFETTLLNVAYTSLAAYKAARPTLDQNSVSTDPGFTTSAKAGVFGGPVTVAGQTAGAVKFQRRPEWARLSNAWSKGYLGLDGYWPPVGA